MSSISLAEVEVRARKNFKLLIDRHNSEGYSDEVIEMHTTVDGEPQLAYYLRFTKECCDCKYYLIRKITNLN